MKTFTIDTDNAITVHASRKAAKETGAGVFATEGEFAEQIGSDSKRLISIWNSLTGVAPVKKFKDSKTGVSRIWKQIQSLGEVAAAKLAASEPEPAPAEAPVAAAPQPEAKIEDCGTAAQAIAESTEPATPFDDAPQTSQEPAASEQEAQATTELPEPPADSEPTPSAPVASADAQGADAAPVAPDPTKKAARAKKAPKANQEAKAAKSDGPREGSKTAQVVTMLQREGGATLVEIMTTMGWQKHTVRGFMAGAMKKAGYTVESFKPEGGERSYRINK